MPTASPDAISTEKLAVGIALNNFANAIAAWDSQPATPFYTPDNAIAKSRMPAARKAVNSTPPRHQIDNIVQEPEIATP